MTTVALLFVNYGPYHFSRLSAFDQICRQKNWQVIGIEIARSEAEYAWTTNIEQLPYELMSVIPDRPLESVSLLSLMIKLFTVLAQVNPDVVAICGYAHPTMLAALVWSVWHRKAIVLLSDSKADDSPRRWWKEWPKQLLLKLYPAALVAGKPQARYVIQLGMSPESIFWGFDVVENKTFHPSKIRTTPQPLKFPFFLSVNRFVPEKNLPNLLIAYANYCQQSGDGAWHLVLCGDGPLRPGLEQQIRSLGLAERVHLPGFLQQASLIPYYAHASCFIHASIKDTWGLVVNEAMAAGLPVLVSKRCGCFEDLVIEGVNGFGFVPEDMQELADLMVQISANESDRDRMGQAALQHIQKFSPEYFAENLYQASQYALGQTDTCKSLNLNH
jgi:1,2-diacylglycerol 3-alpha-glucosyltransferase